LVALRDKIATPPLPAIDYDRTSDVLYVSRGKPVPDEGEDYPEGVVLRFAVKDNQPSGVTVIGVRRGGWHNRLNELSVIIARHLKVGAQPTHDALERVINS
jgi:hypothetical protein